MEKFILKKDNKYLTNFYKDNFSKLQKVLGTNKKNAIIFSSEKDATSTAKRLKLEVEILKV